MIIIPYFELKNSLINILKKLYQLVPPLVYYVIGKLSFSEEKKCTHWRLLILALVHLAHLGRNPLLLEFNQVPFQKFLIRFLKYKD